MLITAICVRLRITAICGRRIIPTEYIPVGESPTDAVASKRQSAHNVKCRVERGPTMTEKDGNGLACGVRFLRKNSTEETVWHDWNGCSELSRRSNHVIESDAHETNGPNFTFSSETEA
jgi:hypothetical protein